MIERKFVAEKLKEFQIQEYIGESLKGAGQSQTKLQKTPLGEKIVIYASKPGIIVGRSGENIKNLTKVLKKKFGLENPQIEISEIQNPNLDSAIVAENIAMALEKFGSSKFKAVGHKTMETVMKSGALGVEIRISGKIPSSRAKSWRFYQGYLKKCGDKALTEIKTAYAAAELKSGTVGIRVKIMTPDFPTDTINVIKEADEIKNKDAAEVEKVEGSEEKSDVQAQKEKKSKKKNSKKKVKSEETKENEDGKDQ